MINFISDLDQTLIYSKRNINIDKDQVKCVEYINEKSITYMTNTAYQNFNSLIQNPEFNFIPCTLRDFNLAMRISFINNHLPKFMICDNGGRIYINGKEDLNYRKKIEQIIDNELLMKYKKEIEKIITDGYVKYNNQSFLTCIFTSKETAEIQKKEIINNIIDTTLVSYELQNRKLYIIPKKLDKVNAVQYLIQEYNIQNLITSGDGKVDEKFTSLGQQILLPKHAVFSNILEVRTNYDGILAGEEIINKLMLII